MEHMDRLYESPLAIPLDDIHHLLASEGFGLLRRFLQNDADFCDFHAASDAQTRETWLLHRDLLHALIMPIVELYRRAGALASTALCTARTEDLELAFTGEARGAFLWLQCFIAGEEGDWCQTRGCPACVTTATLSTESHIRLTVAASLVSTASIASPTSSPAVSASSSPASSPVCEGLPENTISSPSLPPIPHILPALRSALDSDPFWGPSYWPYLLSRATQLSGGIQSLIADCVDLESLVSASTSPAGVRLLRTPSGQLIGQGSAEEKGMKLRKSKLAKRQLRMKGEETEYMRTGSDPEDCIMHRQHLVLDVGIGGSPSPLMPAARISREHLTFQDASNVHPSGDHERACVG